MSRTKDIRMWMAVLLLALGSAYFVLDRMVLTPDGITTLTWIVPTQNELDEPLTDLAGYNIRCWADAGRYTNTIHVSDPTVTSYVIEELAPGKYFCAISAIDKDGDESALSIVVAKSVR